MPVIDPSVLERLRYTHLIRFRDGKLLNSLPLSEAPTIDAVPLSEIYRVIAGHSDYHGDAILAALTCIAEGKDVKPIKPLEVNAAVTASNKNEPLTIEELRTMNEQPVWCETLGCWGIVIIENVGQWAGIPFLLGHQGCQFEFDIESRGLVVYRTKPITGVEK